jgi:hypothetical protein
VNDSSFNEKRKHHCQAISFMSDLDDGNFPVTLAICVSLFNWVSPEQYRGGLANMIP